MVVGPAGGHEPEALRHPSQPPPFVGGVAAVDGFDPPQSGLGQLAHQPFQGGRVETEGQGVGEHGHAARSGGQTGHLVRRQAGLGHIGGASVGQPAVEGVVDVGRRPGLHEGPGEMGPAQSGLASGLGHHGVVVDGHPELVQAGPEPEVALGPVPAQLHQLVLDGPLARFDEVDEHVDRATNGGLAGRRWRLAAGHLTAADEGDAHPGGRLPCLGQAVEAVVVGEGHGRATGSGRHLGDGPRWFGPVRHGRMGVQVDQTRPSGALAS